MGYTMYHQHSENSVKDSPLTIKDMVKRAKEVRATSLTLTDHGTMTGVIEFLAECSKNGINGIPGVELYVETPYAKHAHLTAVAKNYRGYQDLCMLLTEGNKRLEGIGGIVSPIVTLKQLKTYLADGNVILSSACISGVLASILTYNDQINHQMEKEKARMAKCVDPKDPAYVKNKELEQQYSKETETLTERKKELTKLAGRPFKKRQAGLTALTGEALEEAEAKLEADMRESEDAAVELEKVKSDLTKAKRRYSAVHTLCRKAETTHVKWNESNEALEKLKASLLTREQAYEKAKKLALWFKDTFGYDFRIELQYHGLGSERFVMNELCRIARECQIPVIAANDAHIAIREQAEARQILKALRFHRWEDATAFDLELYMKDEKELYQALVSVLPEDMAKAAILGERRVGNECHVEIPKDTHYPAYRNADGTIPANPGAILRTKAQEGIRKRFPNGTWTKEYQDRMDYELSVIDDLGYSNYILVVADYINYAKSIDPNGVGPGRGSGVGSLVNYLIGITNLDPLKYNLLFERFLNKDRVSNPDIDTDFSSVTREPTIEYVKQKYGVESVSCIRTKLTQAAKAAIKNCARIRGIQMKGEDDKEGMAQYRQLGEAMAALIPKDGTMDNSKELLHDAFGNNPEAMRIAEMAKSVENTMTGTSVHAAGIVIGDGTPLSHYVPLLYNTSKGQWATQADMIQVEHDLRMLKFDFLGLNNLDIISDSVKLIKQTTGKDVDMWSLPFEDKVFSDIFTAGNTDCVFQFESGGMKRMLRQFKPDRFEDIILAVAAYRPGPMQFIPNIINVKNGKAKSELCILPVLDKILAPTYGYPIYQEQIMDIFHRCAGFSLGEADIIRRHMSKKHVEEFQSYRGQFVNGVVKMGASKNDAEMLWESLIGFASYGFNKSHAAAYAYISYETAWLKYHYPKEYMCAMLNHTEVKKIPHLLGVCRSMGIKVVIPDINRSSDDFTVGTDAICYGLTAIRTLDRNTVSAILKAREDGPFTGFPDFLLRTKLGTGAVEKLIRAGAFSGFSGSRTGLSMIIGDIEHEIDIVKKKDAILKDLEKDPQNARRLKNAEDARAEALAKIRKIQIPVVDDSTETILEDEHEMLGTYLSIHPLDDYAYLDHDKTVTKVKDFTTDFRTYAGVITNLRMAKRKSDGTDMAFFDLEDRTGTLSVCCFTECYKKYGNMIREGAVVKISGRGKVTDKDDEEQEELYAKSIQVCAKEVPPIVIGIKDKAALNTLNMMINSYKEENGIPVCYYCPWEDSDHLIRQNFTVRSDIMTGLDKNNFTVRRLRLPKQ